MKTLVHGKVVEKVEPPASSYQLRADAWLHACFGAEIARDKTERNHRFLEEALELVQSAGCTQSEAHQLVDYVYGRDVGEMGQEIGGVMNTLAALCLAHGHSMEACGDIELARCWTKIEKIRAKQAAKPTAASGTCMTAYRSTPAFAANPLAVSERDATIARLSAELEGMREGYDQLLKSNEALSGVAHECTEEIRRLSAENERLSAEHCEHATGDERGNMVCTEVERLKAELEAATKERRICSVCGDATDLCCSDCRINFQTTIYVCRKASCRDEHEIKCYGDGRRAAELREALEPFGEFANALTEATPDKIALGIYASGEMHFGPNGGATVGALRRARAALAKLSAKEA